MTIRRFISAIFILAAIIVGAVDLSHHRFRRPPVEMDFAGLTHADHSFIAADRPGVSIECPVTALKDWNEIWTHELNPCSLGDGWLLPGSWGSNAFGTRAQVQIEIGDEIPHTLALRLRASGTLGENVEQSIRILVNGRDIGEHPVSRKWHAIRQAIPTGVLVSGRNQITLDFAHATSHRQADSGKDSRAIAATVDRMAFLITSGSAGSPSDETATTSVWDDQLQSFAIGQSGALVLPLLIPRGAHEIEFELQPSRSVDLSSAKVVLASEDLDGGNRRQASMDGRLIRDRGRIGLPVTDLAGRWALVTIDVSIDGGQLAISAPRIVSGADVPTHEPSSPFVPSAVESLPDIVLITLDAARGDRLSSAGYSRKTTPFIDRIARESLVFKNAFALAPYTLCSVPTMITGLSPLDHGVVYHEDVLSPDAVTLAESLQSRGYLTVAFSATPNNSKSKGFAQGYDVFREIWKEKPGKVSRRAHFAAKRVVEWLDTIEDDRPLHLQVHLIPPHAPYDPPDRFDLFTDPFYDGPCDGYNQTISTVDGREVPATPECIEHLNNLYDGNLRTADDAARIVINALRQRPRWKDTVVLITSDHGEAFWDHKMLGHNSSVYKEMLHVPFVLRLPPTHRDHTIDTNRLVTLADIVPTLLGTAGITTEGGDGVDLLDPTTEAQGRYMIARTTEKRPFWGLRTLRWSLMVNSAGSGALFDLSTDPDELDNIWGSQSATAAGLGRIFSRRIGLPPRLTAANESAEITENDRDLLEALGYVND